MFITFTADCPRSDQTRFEDHCYEYALGSSSLDIVSNINACKEKQSELWVPETSAEHHFVQQSFTGATSNDTLYHLGITQYFKNHGFYGVDHSYHVGSPYFSLDTDVNGNEGELINNGTGPCLVLDRQSKLWKMVDPCGNAIGVCKSKLGIDIEIRVKLFGRRCFEFLNIKKNIKV